jgi:T4 RnlA family RNA ligase
MGITDVALSAEEFVATRPEYKAFARRCINTGMTPIFEFCSRRHRIVVDHPEDRLVLLAVRMNWSGQYVSYDELLKAGKEYGIEVVKQYPGTADSMERLVSNVRDETEGEGWIIRFDDGHMVKIKNETYVRLHKTKDKIRYERNLVDVILNEEVDDLKSFMTDDDLARVEEYERNFWHDFYDYVHRVQKLYNEQSQRNDRKGFALESQDWDKNLRSSIFELWNGREALDVVTRQFEKHLGSNKKFEQIKDKLPNCDWSVEEE